MDYSLLSGAPLFSGITVREIESILSPVQYRLKKFREGAMIAQSGDTVTLFMIVLSGKVKGEMIDYTGKIIKIEDIPPGRALASAFVFGNKNRFPVNVIALTDTLLLCIEKSDFISLLKRDERILVNLLDMISDRSQFLSEKIKFLNFKTIKGKLAQFILQKSQKDSIVVNLGMTQNEIADFFGVARPSIA